MTPQAPTVSLEERPPAGRVAERDRAGVAPIHGSQIGDDAGELAGVVTSARHGRAGNATADDARQIAIGGRVAERTAAERDGRDRVPVGAMARRTVREIQAAPVLTSASA